MVNGMGRDRGAALRARAGDPPRHRQRRGPHARLRLVQRAPGRGPRRGGAPAPGRLCSCGGGAASTELTSLPARCSPRNVVLLLADGGALSRLSPAVEPPPRARAPRLSTESRRALWRLSALFGLDSRRRRASSRRPCSSFFFAQPLRRRGDVDRRPVLRSRASPTPPRTSAPPGSRSASASSTRWSSRTSRRASCSSRSRSRRASRSRRCCSSAARAWSRWTCRRGSPT